MSLFLIMLGYYRQVVDATKELFIRILMGILIFLGYVLLSLFIYAVMRRIMVPQKLHVVPVHLTYDSRCLVSQPKIQHISACSFPQARVLLNNGNKLLRSGHHYSMVLELEVPDSHVNVEAGVFMVNLTFYTSNNQYLATSARPTMVHYKSALLKTMHAVFYAFPLLLGFMEQEQTLELVLFENYYEPYGDGSITALVTVESHNIGIYSSRLVINADFSGFTYYLYQWPMSMSIIVVISILITLCTCTVMLWVRDVVQDFEERRSMGLQRRRQMQHVPVDRTRTGARGVVRPPAAEHRLEVQRPPPPLQREAETVGRGSGELLPGGVPDAMDTDTPTNTRESSAVPGDTDSEAGRREEFGEVIHTLQFLSQELDQDQSSTSTEENVTDGAELRQRSGLLRPEQSHDEN